MIPERDHVQPGSPVAWVLEQIDAHVASKGRPPGLILFSQDVLAEVYEDCRLVMEIDIEPFSLGITLRKPIKLFGCEIGVLGGARRMVML